MVKQVPVSFKNHKGLTLRGVVHVPKKYDTAIVLLHGFPTTMDRLTKRFCLALSKQGFLCLRFNFSGAGTSEGKFETKLMSEEVKDTRAAIDFVTQHYPTKKLVLFGYSTGATDAALYAHTDKRLHGLVLGGAVSHLDRAVHYDFTDRQVHDFWTKGFTYKSLKKRKGRWNPPNKGKLRKGFYDEFFTLDMLGAMKKYRKPLLILHGEKDVIPVDREPQELYAFSNKPKKLVVIKGADHGLKKGFSQAVQAVNRFIRSV